MRDSKFTLFQKVLGGIGAILIPVTIFAIEQWLTKPPPPPPTAIISINGQVIDRAANRLLEGVVVKINVSTYSKQQATDSLGRYAFSIEGFDPRESGSIQAVAQGYKSVIYNESLEEMSSTQALDLEAVPEPVATPGKPAVASHPLTAHYVPRNDALRFAAPIHH